MYPPSQHQLLEELKRIYYDPECVSMGSSINKRIYICIISGTFTQLTSQNRSEYNYIVILSEKNCVKVILTDKTNPTRIREVSFQYKDSSCTTELARRIESVSNKMMNLNIF